MPRSPVDAWDHRSGDGADHEHLFEALDDSSTRMTDAMTTSLPFGLLGWLAARLVAAPYLRRLLRQRASHIKRLAESV